MSSLISVSNYIGNSTVTLQLEAKTALKIALDHVDCHLAREVASESLYSFYKQYKFCISEKIQKMVFDLYKEGALKKNEESFFGLFICYELGIGVSENKHLSRRFLEKANETFLEAKYYKNKLFLTENYLNPEKIEEGTLDIYCAAEELIEKGSAFGYILLGYYHRFKKDKNEQEQEVYFKKGADQGNREAFFLLGLLYYKGSDAIKNLDQAFFYFQKAADKDYPLAWMYLGHCYALGRGVEQNEVLAFQYYLMAKRKGNTEVLVYIGAAYLKGRGTEESKELAFKNFREAYELGDKKSISHLAFCYLYGWGTSQYQEKALQLILEISPLEDPFLLHMVAEAYNSGWSGIPQNSDLALEYYGKALEQQKEYSLTKLGQYILRVQNNPEKAFKYFLEASRKEEIEGTYFLGYCYEEGIGVKESYEQAVQIYAKAAFLRWRECAKTCFPETNNFLEQHKAAIFNKLLMEAEINEPLALQNLGYCYETGMGVEEDKNLAISYYRQAADLGVFASQYHHDVLKKEL